MIRPGARCIAPLAAPSCARPAASARLGAAVPPCSVIVRHQRSNHQLSCAVSRAAPSSRPRHAGLGSLGHFQLARGKTRTSLRIEDLPQGAIPLQDAQPDAAAGPEDGGPAYPTVVLQARRNMRRFDNCVLLTRVGGFYELYFEHADEYGPLLNLKVAQKKTSAGPVPMAGFPFFQLDRFLKILVQDLNRYVAIAEEFPNNAADKAKSGGLMHDRRVARIITPGTLIDENFMDPYANNYVMAIHVDERLGQPQQPSLGETRLDAEATYSVAALSSVPLGLAWLDLSTGQFFTQSTDIASLGSILSRVSPKEIVLDRAFESQKDHDLFSILADDKHLITYAPPGEHLSLSDWAPMLESDIPAASRDSFTPDEVAAGSLVLRYVGDRLQGTSMKLLPPLRFENMQIMNIDKNSMRSLEIKQTIRDGAYRGSLLHAIRRTVTKSGARLLSEWLTSPSTSLEVIKARQDLVECFIENEDLRDEIVILLRRTHDSHRLVQKFALGRGDADDLLALSNTIKATEDIGTIMNNRLGTEGQLEGDPLSSGKDCLTAIFSRISLEGPLRLAQRIKEAIDEEGIVQQHHIQDSEEGRMLALAEEIVGTQGTPDDAAVLPKGKKRKPTSLREHYADDNEAWIMKPDASPALQKLHSKLKELNQERAELTEQLRERLGAPSLTLRWTPGLGHICHVKGKDAASVTGVRALSASRSTRSFHQPGWTQLGQKLDHVRVQIRAEEQAVFRRLREHVVLALIALRRNAAVLDELDVATSFARLALEQGLVRPLLNASTAHTIVGGRHPTVEGGLHERGRGFVGNDCLVGSPGHGRLWLITGPNMAGKSTFLRQNALITILAQAGCYVPAAHAELGVVDAIFSRVGSADNLYRDQSTFMVEMLETAQILHAATPRSFVIMDEIGRGTTPEDGTAVAFACLHHLVTVNQCRVLFATHFHAVADLAGREGLEGTAGGVEYYCSDVEEDGRGGFFYVHKLQKGINRQSHALKVARLAGLPEAAIRMAKQVLEGEEHVSSRNGSEAGDHGAGKAVEAGG